MAYANGTLARNVNATVFAIGSGQSTGGVYTKGTATPDLYISNITEVNGVGSVGQPVVMYFSLTNPGAKQFSVNLTIDHEWYTGQLHGVNATFQLKLGDEPFTRAPLTFVLQAAFTSGGIQLTIRSLQTNNRITVGMTPGSGASSVPFLRQHSGLFRLTIHANTTTTSGRAFSTSSLESPTYAYVLYAPLIPSQLVAYSATVETKADGTFSTAVPASQLLGFRNLEIVALARDSNGLVLGDLTRNPSLTNDSTTVSPTVDAPGSAAVQQSVTVTLHLKSNSTILPLTMIVNLDLTSSSGSIPTQTRTVSISSGTTQDASFTFTTPSTPGLYALTFSSPQYGGTGSPLLTKSLQVSLVSSSVQVLIVVAIGLGAAIVMLGVYLSRRTVSTDEARSKETTRAAKGSKSKPDN